MRALRRPTLWLIVAVTLVFALLPLLRNDVALREGLLLAAVYVILATNVNLMIGYAGYVNFGNVVFFGLGGYACVWLVNSHAWPLVAAALFAGALVSLVAFLFGLGILKLRGAYFALATIGVNEGVKAFVANFTPWGGSAGIYLSIEAYQPLGGPARALWTIYFLMVLVMLLSLLASYGIKNAKFGLGLRAIGQNEDAAMVLGVPTRRYKALIYSASAFLPAMAGALFFFKSAFIQPDDAFDLALSTEAIVAVMLGGQGTLVGPALGAVFYEEMRSTLLTAQAFSHFQLVIAGALLLLIVQFVPGGLMGWLYRRWPCMRRILE
jgi:branched-chain amino acid transport system permease protein